MSIFLRSESRTTAVNASLRARTVTGLAALGLVAGIAGPAAPAFATPATDGPSLGVIVRYDAAGATAAERAVTRAGGTVGQRLDLIGGFTAQVPQGALAGLRAAAGVEAVTPNADVRFASTDEWAADSDVSSLYGITRSNGAQDAWTQGITGEGVGVALIDSGVVPVAGLDGAGKIVNGPDLSFESQAENLRYLDTFGHGTHLAGIIAGRDAATAGQADPAQFAGVAPGAHLVNVKVAAADGATDVSQVIAAIDWVVTHRDDPGLNIRVLNLAFGTDSVQDARLDPLSYAVDAAWRNGIVVAVAVGNDGADQDLVNMPASNERVIAVGAVDPNKTETRSDDKVADFSTAGNADRHADIFAAGKSVVSLRNPGSYADTNHPEGLVAGDSSTRFFRGSGTSQATAVVSGAAALLLQQRPELTPDQVKKILTTSADGLTAAAGKTFGSGQLDVARALATKTPSLESARQNAPEATGLGSLEASRGSAHVVDPETGDVLVGEQDIFGQPWNPQVWAAAADKAGAWTGGTWNGTEWAGADWNGTSWAGRTWSGRTWSGRTWSGRTWSGRTWSDAAWNGRTWSGRTWSGRTWSGRTWSDDSWEGRTWSGRTWSGRTWSGRTWSGRTWSGRTWSGRTWSGRTWSGRTWSGRTWSGRTWSGRTWSGDAWQ